MQAKLLQAYHIKSRVQSTRSLKSMLFINTAICGKSIKKSKEMIAMKVGIVVTSKRNVTKKRHMGASEILALF